MPSSTLRKLTPRRIWLALRARTTPFRKGIRAGRVQVGQGTYGLPNLAVFDGDGSTKLVIGNYCSIASTSTFLLGGNHPVDRWTTFPIRQRLAVSTDSRDGFPSSRGNITVGHGAWVGHEALILSGVSIGNGAVVAARAVVTRDVPPYAIVAGNPAKIIRYRANYEQQRAIENSEWWIWSPSKVLEEVAFLNEQRLDEA